MSTRVLKHPFLGLAAGALTGSTLVATFLTLSYATAYPVEGGTFVPDARAIAGWGAASFAMAMIVWSLGLLVVDYPIWRILDGRGVRGPLAAALFGVAAVYLISLLLVPTSVPFTPDLPGMLLAFSGGMVGLVIERTAYSDAKPLPPPPARPS